MEAAGIPQARGIKCYSVEEVLSVIRSSFIEGDGVVLKARGLITAPAHIFLSAGDEFKDKTGFVVARVRVIRGGRRRPIRKHNRRSKRQTNRKILSMNYRWVAEQRAAGKFKNLEVLNSYLIAKDGVHYFFEVILVDPERPEIQCCRN